MCTNSSTVAVAICIALCVTGSQAINSDKKISSGVLRPRYPAPGFTAQAVVNETFSQLSLANYTGSWLVLMFYPFDFTFVCPTEVGQRQSGSVVWLFRTN